MMHYTSGVEKVAFVLFLGGTVLFFVWVGCALAEEVTA